MASPMTEDEHPYLYKLVNEHLLLLAKNDNQFCERPAIATLTFDGSKRSLNIAFGNITSVRELREYGLMNKMQKILDAISCLYEQFSPVNEIIVGNGDDLLIKICNIASPSTENILYLDMRPVLEKIACTHLRNTEIVQTARKIDEYVMDGKTDESREQSQMKYKRGLMVFILSMAVVAVAFISSFAKKE